MSAFFGGAWLIQNPDGVCLREFSREPRPQHVDAAADQQVVLVGPAIQSAGSLRGKHFEIAVAGGLKPVAELVDCSDGADTRERTSRRCRTGDFPGKGGC